MMEKSLNYAYPRRFDKGGPVSKLSPSGFGATETTHGITMARDSSGDIVPGMFVAKYADGSYSAPVTAANIEPLRQGLLSGEVTSGSYSADEAANMAGKNTYLKTDNVNVVDADVSGGFGGASGMSNEMLGNDTVFVQFADGTKVTAQKGMIDAMNQYDLLGNIQSRDDFNNMVLDISRASVRDPKSDLGMAHSLFNEKQIAYNTALTEANPEIAQNRLAFVQRYAPNNQAAIDAAQSLVDQYSGGTGVNFTPSSMTSMTNVDMTAPATDGGIASLVPEAPETDPNVSNQTYESNPFLRISGLSSFYRPPTEQYNVPTMFGGPVNTQQIMAQDRSLNSPFQRPMNFSSGGEVPSWVDPDYGYTEGRKPNMREMMEHLSGRSVEELYADPDSNWQQYSKAATEILYGSVGSNTDTRDFNKIMSAGSAGDTQAIKQAAGAATREMYNNQSRTEKELAKIQMDYAKDGLSVNPITQNIAQVISFDPATNGYGTSLYMTDNQGVLLRQINDNTDTSLFGINQDEVDTARQQMVAQSSLADYYNPPDQSALETILGTTGTDMPAEQATSLTSLDGNTTGTGSPLKQIVAAARDGLPSGSRESYSVGMIGDLTPSYTPPAQASVATMFGGQPMPSETLMATSYTNPFRRPT